MLSLVLPALALLPNPQTALLRTVDVDPAGQQGELITLFATVEVNRTGGFACSYYGSGPGFPPVRIWGSMDGGAGTILRTPETIGGIVQETIDPEFGLSNESVGYTSTVRDLTGGGSLESLWLDDTPLFLAGDQAPGGGVFFEFEYPELTESGLPYFRAKITMPGGNPSGYLGIFSGTTPVTVYLGGESYGAAAPALQHFGVGPIAISASGTRNAILLSDEQFDPMIAVDGQVLSLAGQPVCCRNWIPFQVGISGTWFPRRTRVSDAGQVAFSARNDIGSLSRGFIVRGNSIAAIEGEMLGGRVLDGSPLDFAFDGGEELVHAWAHPSSPGFPADFTLYVEDQPVLRKGDPVDWDGDGVLDPGVEFYSFRSQGSQLAVGTDGSIYFLAKVRANGSFEEGLFVLPGDGVGRTYCTGNVNVSGVPAALRGRGSASLASNDLTLDVTRLPRQTFSMIIAGRNQGFLPGAAGGAGNLCILDPIGRLVGGSILRNGPNGAVSVDVDWNLIPQPSGTVAAVVGETWNFQSWTRDTTAMGQATFNYSNGLEVQVQP